MTTASKQTKDQQNPRKTPAWILNLLLLSCSVLVPLLIAEFALRIMHHSTISFDDRSFRESHWSLKPNTFDPSYVGVPVHINNLGLRGPNTTETKPPGTFRILGVGDSVMFGYGLKYSDTFLKVAEKTLNSQSGGKPHYEVLNSGICATGLDYYDHFIETRAVDLQPDVIVVSMALNDIDPDLPMEPKEPVIKPTIFGRINRLFLSHSYLYNALYVPTKSLLYKMNILKLKDNDGFGFLALEPPSPEQEQARRMTAVYLARMSSFAAAHKIPFAVIIFADQVQLSEDARLMYQQKLHLYFGPEVVTEDQPEKWVQAIGQQDGFPVMSVLPALRSIDYRTAYLSNRSISVDPVHPSVAGAKVLGVAIADFLKQNGMTAH